jgi:hypothetical protein
MKEDKFIEELEYLYFSDGIIIPVYYTPDEKDNVILDIDMMEEEFKSKLEDLKELLKCRKKN